MRPLFQDNPILGGFATGLPLATAIITSLEGGPIVVVFGLLVVFAYIGYRTYPR